jgi:hypothetical protein
MYIEGLIEQLHLNKTRRRSEDEEDRCKSRRFMYTVHAQLKHLRNQGLLQVRFLHQ